MLQAGWFAARLVRAVDFRGRLRKMKKRKPAWILLVSGLVTAAAFLFSCGPGATPAWLAEAQDLEELLASQAALAKPAMAADGESVLLAGEFRPGGDAAAEIFAVRATLEGGITERWLLTPLGNAEELLDLKVFNLERGEESEKGFCVVAVVERSEGGDAAYYWRILSSGPGARLELPSVSGDCSEAAMRDMHLVSAVGNDYLIFGKDCISGADGITSSLVMKNMAESGGGEAAVLGGYSGAKMWDVSAVAPGPGGAAVAVSRRETDVYSTALSFFDGNGKKLAEPLLLFTAKYLFPTSFIWDEELGEWILLWGTSHRYWFQRVSFSDGVLSPLFDPAPELDFGATLRAFRREGDVFRAVVEDGRRVLSVAFDSDGVRAGSSKELIGIGETGNRRLHLLSACWAGDRLALLMSLGDDFVYRLVEP